MKKMVFVILIIINFSILGVGEQVAWGPKYHYVVEATPFDFDRTMNNAAKMLSNECENSETEAETVKRSEFLFTAFKYRNYDAFDFYCPKMSVSFTLNWNYFTSILSDNEKDITKILRGAICAPTTDKLSSP